jgi:N-acetylglutamate synthase-like GNAT family acetyltransferase
MTSPSYRVRRATLEDIGQLTSLWQSMKLPVEDLGRRITEFQVAEGLAGEVLGGVGLQITERQGRIHSEGFTDFALADQLRPLLWERIHSVATNHGLLRLWTQEDAPFWNHCGLQKPDAEALEKMPATWRNARSEWLTVKLREDVAEVISADQEFALFMQAEKARTERAFQHARILKAIATLIALILLGVVVVGAFFVLHKNPNLLHRG